MRYEIGLQMSGLDFNQLIYGSGPFKNRANFAADAYFAGNGLIATGETYSISGDLNITEIDGDVVDRMLDVIDPTNQNPGVAETRKLMHRKILGVVNLSYKPKQFSFELRHGNIYPRLYMDQPFYAEVLPLIRIPMPVEYGRIPVKNLLDSMLEGTW
jgi:hypothetical protein